MLSENLFENVNDGQVDEGVLANGLAEVQMVLVRHIKVAIAEESTLKRHNNHFYVLEDLHRRSLGDRHNFDRLLKLHDIF